MPMQGLMTPPLEEDDSLGPLDVIVGWLNQEGIEHDLQPGMVTLRSIGRFAEYDTSFNWDEDMDLLQFACGWDQKIPSRRVRQLGLLLERLNFELTFGRLLQYPEGNMVLFHASMPLLRRQLTEPEIRFFLKSGCQTMDLFMLLIKQVLAGTSAKETLAQKEFLLMHEDVPIC